MLAVYALKVFICTGRLVSNVLERPTSGGWLGGGWHCTRGTSSSSAHSVWPPLSTLFTQTYAKACQQSNDTENDSDETVLGHIRDGRNFQTIPIAYGQRQVCFRAHSGAADSPRISLVNLTRWESVRGLVCSLMFWMSRTSHMNSMTGWAR